MRTETLHFNLLDDESAIEAIETVGKLANKNNIEWALAGGLAMILYGSERLTKDIDIIASKTLPLGSHALLKQGGVRYLVQTSKQGVAVDWIVRNDEAGRFYQAALVEAVVIKNIPVVKPEWLVILKFIAARTKDTDDYRFLLGCPNMVDREKIKEKVWRIGGKETWAVMKNGLQQWYDIADGKKSSDAGGGYIDS